MKVLKTILLCGCILNCIIIDYFMFVCSGVNTVDSNWLEVFEVIIIFVNFLFVVWIYFRDEKKEKTASLAQKESYWYHDVLIQNNILEIQQFFLLCIEMKEKIHSEGTTDGIKAIMREIKDKKKEIDGGFGYMLNAYNENLYYAFNEQMLKAEDVVTTSLAKLSVEEITDEVYVKEIKELEVKLLKLLMEHDLKRS